MESSLARLVKEMMHWKTLFLKSVHFESAIQFLQLCGRLTLAVNMSQNFSVWFGTRAIQVV